MPRTLHFLSMSKYLALPAVLLLSACATAPKPLYYWGDYQPEVYSYFKADGAEPLDTQIQKLETTAQLAHANSMALPPGFNAHLGLLYLNAGRAAQAQQALLAEAEQFPESRPYMEFLLQNMNNKRGRPQ